MLNSSTKHERGPARKGFTLIELLTRAALSTGGRAETQFLSVTGDMKGLRGIEFDGTGRLFIGHSTETINRAPASWFKGCVDEVMLFDRALTESEVKQIYDAQKCAEAKEVSP